jgi:purine catabolism regulator
MHLQLWRDDIPHLTVHRTGLALSIVGTDSLNSYFRAAGDDTRIGVSETLGDAGRIGDAEREARWALSAADDSSAARVRYGDAAPEIGPRTPDEAEALVNRVLSGVLSRPAPERDELLGTLSSFLHHERSWQHTADAMHLHRQTVLYRIRKMEQLLGLKVSDTGDLAVLWVAMRAWERQRH